VLQKQAIWPICATAATQFSQYSIIEVAVWVADVWTVDVWVADVSVADVWTVDVWVADVWTGKF